MKNFLSVLLACCLVSILAFGQDKSMDEMYAKMDNDGSVRASYLKQAKFVEGECVSLAKAIPQENYTWRPEDGVRSISEAFMHVALGNYIMLQTLGGQVPEGFDMKTYQASTTDKDKVVEELQNSFQAVNDYIAKIPKDEYGQHVKFFGRDMTKLDIIFIAATHQHETLGQAIAYARVNHITPPWTAEQQAREKANSGE